MSPQTFKYHGYFETLFDIERNRTLGTRKVELEVGRALGYAGSREIVLETTVELDRGPKQTMVKASKKRPIRCLSTVSPICGRAIR